MHDPEMKDLFARMREGLPGAEDELFQRVYDQLHRIARAEMAHQRESHTLQATALVNEAYVKLCGGDGSEGGGAMDRTHFLRLAATVMRQVLVDHARKRQAGKRSAAGRRMELDGLVVEYERRSGSLIELDEALEKLAERDPELVELVELRFFSGHTVDEVAAILGSSPRSVARRWQTARLYLKGELEG